MDRREHLDDPIEALRLAQEGHQAKLWTALPGIVAGYDQAAMTGSGQPAIAGVIEDERGVRRTAALPLLVDVPVQFPAGGGFTLTFPIKAGDECIVVFSARCIDSWWQSGGVQPPAERRMHDLSDGMAIVGIRSQQRVLRPEAHTEATELRSDDGSNHVRIAPDGAISVVAAATITLEAPQIRLKGALSVTGLDGGDTVAALQGQLQASDDVTARAISLAGHVHTGVMPGGGDTGAAR